MVQLRHLSAAPQRDDICLSLASNWNRCLHRSREDILAVAPCQRSRVTPCLLFVLISSREMLPSAGAQEAASRTTSGAPGNGGATSRGAAFRVKMGKFLFWAMHWGMSDGCIVGFARLVYCCYCLTDLSKLFCGTYNIAICMMIWHLLLYSVQAKLIWCISSMMCSWKLLKCIVKICIWCEIKLCGKK